VTMRDGNLW